MGLLAILGGLWYLALLPEGLNWDHPVPAAAFLVAELVCLGVFVLSVANVWNYRFKPLEGLQAERPYSVDVFITTCGEPLSVIEPSVVAATRLFWEGDLNVYILDDGGSGEVEALARAHGVTYRSRPREGVPQKDGKAGNLNFGLENSQGELVFTLDADQVPSPSALVPMAGYMKFDRVAFVQSKQQFDVPEGDPFNSDDPVFYDGVQLAFDADDTVISCGSGCLYRREALEDIGGFTTWNLVEDLTTSYDLHSHGWKSLYYPYAVTRGQAPKDINGIYQQRGQWALDTMRLFWWDNPMLKKGLAWRARLNHFLVGFSYIWAGFVMPIFFLIPLWSYLTGESLIDTSEVEIVAVRVLYFLLFAVAVKYLFRDRQPGKQFQFLAGLFPVYMLGTLKALLYPRGRKPGYRVNGVVAEKSRKRERPVVLTILPQITLFGANALLPFYAILWADVNPWIVLGNGLVSAFNLWTLWPIVTGSLFARRLREPAAGRVGEQPSFAG